MNTLWTPERKQAALATLAKWHGTPHRDRIAIPGVGIDCIQLILEIFADADLLPRHQITGYDVKDGAHEQSDRLKLAFKSCTDMVEVPLAEMTFGDVVVFKTGKRSGHVGFYTDNEIWHALAARCVTVSRLNLWRHEIDTVLRLQTPGYKSDPQFAANL